MNTKRIAPVTQSDNISAKSIVIDVNIRRIQTENDQNPDDYKEYDNNLVNTFNNNN